MLIEDLNADTMALGHKVSAPKEEEAEQAHEEARPSPPLEV